MAGILTAASRHFSEHGIQSTGLEIHGLQRFTGNALSAEPFPLRHGTRRHFCKVRHAELSRLRRVSMRLRLLTLVVLSSFATMASAKEVWLSIGGTTAGGTFRTDPRIFNPSPTKDIQIQAWYLPVGNADNSAVQPLAPITVLKRQQVVYNDVV